MPDDLNAPASKPSVDAKVDPETPFAGARADGSPTSEAPSVSPPEDAIAPVAERDAVAPVAERDAVAPVAAQELGAPATKPTEASSAAVGIGASLPRPSFVFLIVVTAITLGADLGSKWWATSRLLDDPLAVRRVEIIKGYVGLIHARNKGGAWGLLQDESESIRKPFFLVISAAAIIFILSLYRRLTPEQRALKWGLPLVLGGALGNLVDRIRYDHVVDFIDVRITKTFTWPTFNVADIAICVGVGLMAIDMFASRSSRGGTGPQGKGTTDLPSPAKTEQDAAARSSNEVESTNPIASTSTVESKASGAPATTEPTLGDASDSSGLRPPAERV